MPALKLRTPAKPKLITAKTSASPPPSITGKSKIVDAYDGLKPSTLKTFDIPFERLVAHGENPNEQSEKTFDEIVNRIREDGFDEPIHVYPQLVNGKPTQKFVIFSGHHRVKAGKSLGMTHFPAIIREGWSEDRVAMELITRNQLRGNLNPHKFTEIYDRLKKRYDPEMLKQMMGLSDKKAFNALYKQVRDQLPEKQRAKLDEAKEKVNSVEDLSSVLNTIFREHGSEVDHSFMVFTFGGKRHHYIQVDADTNKLLDALRGQLDKEGVNVGQFFKSILRDTKLSDNVIKTLKAK